MCPNLGHITKLVNDENASQLGTHFLCLLSMFLAELQGNHAELRICQIDMDLM